MHLHVRSTLRLTVTAALAALLVVPAAGRKRKAFPPPYLSSRAMPLTIVDVRRTDTATLLCATVNADASTWKLAPAPYLTWDSVRLPLRSATLYDRHVQPYATRPYVPDSTYRRNARKGDRSVAALDSVVFVFPPLPRGADVVTFETDTARRAARICTAYEGMERFFPAEKIVLTGNPLRGGFSKGGVDRREALVRFGLTEELPVVLVVGGSLGTRSLNEMMKAWILSTGGKAPVQVIWQTGKYYEREMQAFLAAHPAPHVWQGAFIDRMDCAYAAADLVVSRSGAGTVSELCLVAKPVLFVPSPNVAEDHQTKNARALEAKGAAVVVADAECRTTAMRRAEELLADPAALRRMSDNIEQLAKPRAADAIVDEVLRVLEQTKKTKKK